MPQLTCIVVTPETTALEQKVEFVALPLYDGEIGIGPSHGPMIGRLGYGEMRLRVGGKTERYYVGGGFVQVAENVVSILTQRAVPADQLDEQVVRKELDAARGRPADSPELMEIRDRTVTQARAQLRVLEHLASSR